MTEFAAAHDGNDAALAAQPHLQGLVDALAAGTDAVDQAYFTLERLAEQVRCCAVA